MKSDLKKLFIRQQRTMFHEKQETTEISACIPQCIAKWEFSGQDIMWGIMAVPTGLFWEVIKLQFCLGQSLKFTGQSERGAHREKSQKICRGSPQVFIWILTSESMWKHELWLEKLPVKGWKGTVYSAQTWLRIISFPTIQSKKKKPHNSQSITYSEKLSHSEKLCFSSGQSKSWKNTALVPCNKHG